MGWLSEYHERVVLPPVAYVELAFGYRMKYGDTARLDRMLHWADARVDRMDRIHASRAAEIAAAISDTEFKKNVRDYMIAAYAFFAPVWLVTFDKHNFAFLENRVKTPYEVMDVFRRD